MSGILRMLAACAVALLGAGAASAAQCYGRFMNPVSDICWSCVFPVTIGNARTSAAGEDFQTDARTVCSCVGGANARVGVNMGFWEPVRIAEVVREPYCFPVLNGLKLDPGVRAPEPGDSQRHERFGKPKPTTLRHVHWYTNPLIFVLEVLLDTGCLEQGVFDMAYMTELDPLWADEEATFVLQPEAALFSSLPAVAACAADAVAATAGFPITEMFWCAGAQGGLYPLAGWVGHLVSPIDTSVLLMQRMTAKLHRQGQMWAGIGRDAQCGPFLQPVMDKRQYKYQMVYPARATDKSITGSCCHPFGRPTMLWGANKSFPVRGEDFAYQIFRRRDCCAGAGLP